MKKLCILAMILVISLTLCSCQIEEPEFFFDIGARGNLAPCREATEYILEQDEVRLYVKLPHHKGAKGTVVIEKEGVSVFSGLIGETMTSREYKGLLEKTGWLENEKLASVKINDTPLLRAFALMLEADYNLQGWYLSAPFTNTWTEVGLPKQGLAD